MLVLALLAIAVVPALAVGGTPSTQISRPGNITPEMFPGNFVSYDDQQLCYDMPLEIDLTQYDLGGFKINSNDPYPFDGYVGVGITSGKYLAWYTENAQMIGIIVKGGPNYNLYDYSGTVLQADGHGLLIGTPVIGVATSYGGLTAPPLARNKFPEISHYNICYYKTDGDYEGCTPGYWRNHADRWVGVAPGDDFDATFVVDLFYPDITLGTAIWLGGGGINAFARHATAALLNAYAADLDLGGSNGQFVDYPYTVEDVIEKVQDAVADGTIEETKDLFAAANEQYCPLDGTPGCSKANPAACIP
jgi:hypothetical protein